MDKYSINSCCSLWYTHSLASMRLHIHTVSQEIQLYKFSFSDFFFVSFWLEYIKMRDKHSQDRLCSTQQTNGYKKPRILFAYRQPTASNWDWACGGATVSWTATDLSAGCVTTHYAALQNTEASFWHTDSWPDARTSLIFHLMFPWMTIRSFKDHWDFCPHLCFGFWQE